MPVISGLLETALYVDDMARSVTFFEQVVGLRAMLRTERLTAFDAGGRGVLLVFKRGATRDDIRTERGVVAGHDGSGPLHMAFAIPANSYDDWLAHLRAARVVVRGEMHWPAG